MVRTKTETELIGTVANIHDADALLRFAQRAEKEGMPALAAACKERAITLKPIRTPRVRKTMPPGGSTAKALMKTHIVAEQALQLLIDDYKAGKDPTTYSELGRRCGFEGQQNARWLGQVTDLIDAACALAGVPSFALVRVREANGDVNHAAWRKEYGHLRDRIIATALAGLWTDEDFTKLRDALASLSANAFGNKKAWNYVWGQINMETWAAVKVAQR
jgi:hypothetical protein